jgi:hypothetical protein
MAKKRKTEEREINLLDLIPKRLIEYDLGDEELVTLLAPRFKNRLLRRWFEPRLRNPLLKVKLDRIGSATWLLIDGKRNVKEIAAGLRERFGEEIEPCYDRLGLFMRQLEGSHFICFINVKECLEMSRS